MRDPPGERCDTIMATHPTDGRQTPETEDTQEECAGKKKSKFQAFKKLFVKKKRKETLVPSRESNLKPSQSSSDVSAPGFNPTAFRPAHDPGAKGNMGNKALSHDSVFISEPENVTVGKSSQENLPGKVRALQLQLQQNLRLGSPSQIIVSKKLEDSGALSEDDGLPRSPPEMTSLHEILAHSSSKASNPAQRRSSLSLGGTDSEEEQVSSDAPSRPISPFHTHVLLSPASPTCYSLPVDFTTPASPLACLNNTAAKHKIAVKPKKARGIAIKSKQTAGEQPKGTSVPRSEGIAADPKANGEEAQCKGDSAVLTPELEVTAVRVSSHIEETKEDSEKDALPPISATLPPECDEVSRAGDTIGSETGVDCPSDRAQMGNQMEYEAEGMEGGEDNSCQSPETTVPSMFEQNTTAEAVKLSAAQNIETDVTDDVNDDDNDLEWEELEIFTASVSLADEILMYEAKEEEQRGLEGLVTCASEIKKELVDTIESTLIVQETSSPSGEFWEDQLARAVCNSDTAAGVDEVARESLTTWEAVNKATEGPETIAMVESRVSNVNVETTDHLLTNNEGDNLGLNRLLSSELQVEAEPFDPEIIDGKEEEMVNAPDYSSIECNTGDLRTVSSVAGTSDGKGEPLANTDYQTDACKVTKPTETKAESKHRTPTKPVRFTVAPAWQRSLSGGSNVEDAVFSRNINVITLKSELFEGATIPQEPVVGKLDSKKCEKPVEMTEEETSGRFGIRLRRTTSSLKYSDEQAGDNVKQSAPSVDAISLAPSENILNITKTSQISPDVPTLSEPVHPGEEKYQPKIQTEEPSQKPHTEPAWISMAKLKQKGFQDHRLAREQIEDLGVTEQDRRQDTGESLLKMGIVCTSRSPEIKKHTELSSVDITAAGLGEETRGCPEKSAPHNPDEPPWLSLAKKKAKAWSEMPQIVQ
ncbi:acrosomal protein KIAA1210 homolog isoform X2 [Ascaphus truei]|uniref:acrosomal protein KIAA1210 homolog isoform X2 n=1 Tax=Ascaphus truei TaxID=8439 RepID=UPI003F591CB7